MKKKTSPRLQSRLLCTSIAARTVDAMADKAERALRLGSDLVELRVDSLKRLDEDALVRVVSRLSDRCVLTYRPRREGGSFEGDDSRRVAVLGRLSEARPAFLDVELSTAAEFGSEVRSMRRRVGRLVVSWHDFSGTPDSARLRSVCRRARASGDIAKVVTMARTVEDVARVLSLYRGHKGDLVAFCMGESGVLSRVLCLLAGSPFSYASLPDEDAVAPGQIPVGTMRVILGAIGL